MKSILVEALGAPHERARCADLPDPPAPRAGELSVAMVAAPINPADLLQIEGRYGVRPALPYTPGHEGVGRVDAVGEGVKGFAVGDLVLPGVFGTWTERIVCRAAGAFRLPPDVDVLQASMLRANPASAWTMLDGIPGLGAGDWVMQNAGNSAVAGFVHRIAAARGVRTLSVVRRPEAAAAAQASGATAVLVDRFDDDGAFETAAREAMSAIDAKPRVRGAFDAVGGRATARLGRCVDDGGLVLNYGLLSGEDCALRPHDLVFRDVRLHGFWLATWFRGATPDRVRALYDELLAMMRDGRIRASVDATYPLERIADAVAHAGRGGRDGKIVLVTGR